MLIDVNTWLGAWPFRQLPVTSAGELRERLERVGVGRAWAAWAPCILHEDPAPGNEALLAEVAGDAFFVPVLTLNPSLPRFAIEARDLLASRHQPVIRLCPGFHEYGVDEQPFTDALELAAQLGALTTVLLRVGDERKYPSWLGVKPVDLSVLARAARQVPEAKVLAIGMTCGDFRQAGEELALATNVSVEISHWEGLGGVETLAEVLGPERVLYGSHAPVYVPESAALKLAEAELPPDVHEAIAHTNAERLLARA